MPLDGHIVEWETDHHSIGHFVLRVKAFFSEESGWIIKSVTPVLDDTQQDKLQREAEAEYEAEAF